MTRQHEPLPLVGLTEIAQRAGVQKPVVAMWRTRHAAFPEPVATLRTGDVWWWPDVMAWLIETERRHDANLTVEQVNESSPTGTIMSLPPGTKLCGICRVNRVPIGVHACEVCE